MGDKFQTLFNGIQNVFQPAVDVYNQQQQQKQAEQLLAQQKSLMSQGTAQQTSVSQVQNANQSQNRIGGIIEKGIKGFQNWKSKNEQSIKEEKKGGKIKKIRKGQNSLDTSYLFNWNSLPSTNFLDYLIDTGQNQYFPTPENYQMGDFATQSNSSLVQELDEREKDRQNQITTIKSKITDLKAKKNSNPLSNLFGANDLKTAKKTKELADLGEGDAKEAGKALKGARMNTAGMGLGAAADIGMGVMDALKPEKYVGASDTLMKMKQGYDAASNMVMQINPLAGGIMKGVEGILQMTNMLTGKKADSFTVDDQAYENVGGSYSGSYAKAQDAAEKAGTTYGGFAKKQYKKAQEEIAEAKRQQSIVQDVSDTATERFNISDSMAAINNNRRELQMEGGYHQNAVSVGEEGEKLGKSLKRVKKINKKRKKKKLQFGGIIGESDTDKDNITSYSSYNKPVITRAAVQPVEESRIEVVNPELYFPTSNSILIPTEEELTRRINNEYTNINIPSDDDIEQMVANINVGEPRSMEELIQYAEEKNPRFIQRMNEFPMILTFTNDYSLTEEEGLGRTEHGSHLLGWEHGPDGKVYVYPMIMERNVGQGDLFKWDAKDWRENLLEAINRGDYLNMSEDEADLFTENYKKYYNQFMNIFDEMDEYLNSHPDASDQEVREIFMNKYNNNDDKLLKTGVNSELISILYNNPDLTQVNFIRDINPRTEGNNVYYNTPEDIVHELYHYLTNNKPDETYQEFYSNLDNNKLAELGADLNFINGKENEYYQPSELLARLNAAKYMTPDQTYDASFFAKLRNDEDRYGQNMRDLLHMFDNNHLVKLFNLKDTDFNIVPEYQEGGSIIPDGALHAHKHHIETDENITEKGIPVVIENKDGEIEQVAEIERGEIIFSKEFTEKLENLCKQYYNKEIEQEEKENIALQAGQLLVNEILNNTEDKTGELL